MEKTAKRDLKITGSGGSGGGLFHKVSIRGEGSVTGDLDCVEFKTFGEGRVNGHVKSESFHISGSSAIQGDLKAEKMKVLGSSEVEGNVLSREVTIRGAMSVAGNLTGEHISVKGGLTVKGDCEAEIFEAKGKFNIGGLLHAEHVDIRLKDSNKVKEIGGRQIKVEKDNGLFGLGNHSKAVRLTVDIIDGDEIDLEYTKAEVVRGNNVHIGPGCEIQLLEYQGQYRQAKDAEVKEYRKL
ncbi:MAG TPA: hypothetical protein VFT51_09075 [Bacillales bacterium]|nr:hypothetical protein [Bacillales bacterium]